MNLNLKYFLFFAGILCIAFSSLTCQSGNSISEEEKVKSRTTYAGLSDTARYVGMRTCAGCHSGIHQTFIHTGMGLSFDTAGSLKSAAKFDRNIVVKDDFKDLNYHPFWQDGSLLFREFRMDNKDTVYQRTEQVKYIVGSGQHTNSHIWESNGYLFQAPMTFYTQKGQWDFPPGFEKGNNSRFSRKIGLECMTCHNAYPEFEIGSENKYLLVKNGIDCERCHGPGSIHVQEKSRGILIDTSVAIDYSIVNPAKLPIDLQFDVCQRCHIQGNAVLVDGKSFLDFKPGMRLAEVMYVFMPSYRGKENEHIMASHAERLKMSACFIKTSQGLQGIQGSTKPELKPYRKGLTCVTCHNPHISVKTLKNDHFNAICMNCHTSGKEQVCNRTVQAHVSGMNDCVSCHMPKQGTLDIPHVSVHDHRISIPAKKKEVDEMKTFIGITCVNDPDPPAKIKAEAYVNYVEKFGLDLSLLDSALACIDLRTPALQRENIHLLVHIYFLRGDYKSISALVDQSKDLYSALNQKSADNRDAWTSYRIAEALQALGSDQLALSWFRKACQLAPFNPEFANKYASHLAAMKQYKEAKLIFTKLVEEHPYFAPGFCNLGYLLLSMDGDIRSAQIYLDESLRLDPDYELAILNKAATFIAESRLTEARALLQKVLKINPRNQQAIEGLRRLSKS